MTHTATQTPFTQEGFEAFLATRQEPAWLIEQRRQAWETFSRMSWPARNDEEWIRTDIRLFHLGNYSLPTESPADASAFSPLLSEGVELAGSVATVDSQPTHVSLKSRWAERGVIFGGLDELVREHGDLVRKYLFSVVDAEYDRFAALQAACWSGGSLLYVPRGVTVDEPLHVSSAMTDGGSDLGHTLIVLEEGAEATVLCETLSGAEQHGGFHCGALEIIQMPGSNLRFVSLQDWGHKVWHFAHQRASVGRDASLQWTIGALGSRLSKVNQHVALVGPGAYSQVNGTMFTEGTQHISYHTLQHHVAPQCRSDFLYKAALQDKSRTVWRGMIKVDQEAQKTDGYQRNDNLLLSRTARADSIPGLEIEADDVRCTHGSTTGKIDEELIFYAQCRGYTRGEATRMIVTGFFQQIFDRITIESVREALGHAIARRVREYE
ncbi:MAG: Fe-S cluster assembly protein SufD [Pirellulaceae bacterium]